MICVSPFAPGEGDSSNSRQKHLQRCVRASWQEGWVSNLWRLIGRRLLGRFARRVQ